MNPTVSIVMPVYQAADTIAASLESIINQSYTDWELLIMDDGCTDNTLNIIRSYRDKRIRIISCRGEFSDALQTLWNTNRLLIDQKRFSKESALSFISAILEKRSNPIE